MSKNHFVSLTISDKYHNFYFCELFLQHHFRLHFWPFQMNTKFCKQNYKLAAAPILDVRNSLSIAFLAISDRYATLICFENFDKMAAVGHFGCPKFTFDHISGHFRSIQNFCGCFYKMDAGVIGSDVPCLECPACNALTWVITVTE